jgi:hypothetical protein
MLTSREQHAETLSAGGPLNRGRAPSGDQNLVICQNNNRLPLL